jgi:tRNA-uridine 2-sulfurtransferase
MIAARAGLSRPSLQWEGEIVSNTDKERSVKAGAAYGARVAERLRSCSSPGSLETENAVGEAGSASCSALVRIALSLKRGRVEDAGFQAYGCPATLACASEVAVRVRQLPFLDAAAITQLEICRALGLVSSKEASAGLALEALHAALGDAIARGGELCASERELDARGVLVGMSGGVDSAVAAMMLRDRGYRVVGVTLKLWSDPALGDARSCCSPEAVRRARRVAHSLGIPHVTVDASDVFYGRVVKYFVDEYASGRTPNPCVKCNARVRFGLLLDIAHRLGLSRIATGHYARLSGDPLGLTRGVDRSKDQSYVLAEVAPEILRQVIFPLGGMTKVEVRHLAARAGLEGHSLPESQEICFVSDDDHRRFLRERLGERPGAIVDSDGRELGSHSGTYNFTIGQRKGLGIAAPEPTYVVALAAERCAVIVGDARAAAVGSVRIGDITCHRPGQGARGTLQVRSSGEGVPAHSVPGAHAVTIILDEPTLGVAPGQLAVMYDGDRVAMAGTIMSSGPWTDREPCSR